MPKRARELSSVEVKRLKHPTGDGRVPYSFSVGGISGLMLQVTPGGARSWVLRMTIHGRRREMGLGPYPEVGLKKAREEAAEFRAMVRKGKDPVDERVAVKSLAQAEARRRVSFGQAVEQYMDAKLPVSRGNRQRDIIGNRLRDYALPILGNLPVASIHTFEMMQVIEPIWLSKNETAKRTRGHIEAVLSWATAMGLRQGENPARWNGNLRELLPDVSTPDRHRPALQVGEAAAWFRDVADREGNGARALVFTALTAARSGEVRRMTWDELDLNSRLWVIPAARMKMKKGHRVPLSDVAHRLLVALPQINELVFPAPRGCEMSDMTLLKAMRAVHDAGVQVGGRGYLDASSKKPAVVHGLRSTFRVWAAEQGFPRDMAEIALAHKVGNDVERAYMRSDLLERRRSMMQAWAEHLMGKTDVKDLRPNG